MCTFGFDILVWGGLWKAELLKQSLHTRESTSNLCSYKATYLDQHKLILLLNMIIPVYHGFVTIWQWLDKIEMCKNKKFHYAQFRLYFTKQKQPSPALQSWSWKNPDSGDSLSFGTHHVPTFNFSLLASYVHLIWLCPLQKARLKDTWWENMSGTLLKTL